MQIDNIGQDWLLQTVDGMLDELKRIKPSVFCQDNRYLPSSVTSMPGPMSFDVNPYMVEILDCLDIDSPIREVNVLKGVQITFTTAVLECGLFYYILHVKTLPCMFMSADVDLAKIRVENNIIPMLNHSGYGHVIRSSDETNLRKTGKNARQIQWGPDGYLIPFGARSANKMSSFSIAILFKDELDRWLRVVGEDGDPDKLSDARTSGYNDQKKIIRGSTPALAPSRIKAQYLRGDQRKYFVRCLKCGYPQALRWSGVGDGGEVYGMDWDYKDDGTLDKESVRYLCENCQNPHVEMDKYQLFSADNGAEWKPTATPVDPLVRSYHIPGLYSPLGMHTWADQAAEYIEAYDPKSNAVLDIGKYQVFYNNVLGEEFKALGQRVTLQAASSHRRDEYRYGEIPNDFAVEHAGGPILFLTCQVDVHKHDLAVAVMGWTRDARCFLIDYWRFKDGSDVGTESTESSVWVDLRRVVEGEGFEDDVDKRPGVTYTDAAGRDHDVALTLIDTGYNYDTVCTFCDQYEAGVIPIVGRPRTRQTVTEFSEFTTKTGLAGYKIVVDVYKDRIAPALRRDWSPENGTQPKYHFNVPQNATTRQLKELTREHKEVKSDDRGNTWQVWYKSAGAKNELWDLLVYGHAAVEIYARAVCLEVLELDEPDILEFWKHVENELLAC